MRRYDEHQAIAKTKSARLVMIMTMMQVITVLASGAVFGGFAALVGLVFYWDHRANYSFSLTMLAAGVCMMPVVTLIIVLGALWKFQELKEGGRKVAELLRAERIPEVTSDPKHRQLLNIVEELAISSSIPVPPVFVMNGEPGINALAAGHTPQDAVIVVTDGALQRLGRDQIQGVIAHEFAHILNGDMGRNMWLMSFTHGNYCVMLTAQALIDYETKEMVLIEPVADIAGYLLMPLGVMGAFFALTFKALIKRQGEYHADATAVELTRLPNGLSDALLLIGGNRSKGRVRKSGAFEVSHLFFADNGWSFSRWFDTHPPLTKRIRRLKPDWDGYYLFESDGELGDYTGTYKEVLTMVGAVSAAARPKSGREFVENVAMPVVAGLSTASMANRLLPQGTNGNEPRPPGDSPPVEDTPEWLSSGPSYHVEIDPVFLQLAADPQGAGLVLAAIRLSQLETEHREEVAGRLNPLVASSLLQLFPKIDCLNEAQKLTLFDQSLESIGRAPGPVRSLLAQFIEQAKVDPTEETSIDRWAWQRVVSRKLNNEQRPRTQYGELQPLMLETVILVSSVIHTDSESDSANQYTFIRAMAHTGLENTKLLPRESCLIEHLDYSLDRLAQVAGRDKRKILMACGSSVTSNRDISIDEAWIIRAICCGLHYPMPTMVPGQPVIPGA